MLINFCSKINLKNRHIEWIEYVIIKAESRKPVHHLRHGRTQRGAEGAVAHPEFLKTLLISLI
jgi:hypothetical protein